MYIYSCTYRMPQQPLCSRLVPKFGHNYYVNSVYQLVHVPLAVVMLVSICFPSMCCWVHYTLWANSLTNVHVTCECACVNSLQLSLSAVCLSVCLFVNIILITHLCVCVSACICVCVLSDFKLWQTFWQSVECHYILIRVCVCSLVLFVLTCSV